MKKMSPAAVREFLSSGARGQTSRRAGRLRLRSRDFNRRAGSELKLLQKEVAA